MSVQFGRWNFDGQPPAPDYIERVSAILAPYGPDSNESYTKDGVRILYRAFRTTRESHHEKQPHISVSGAVITWDGRLDNRADLISDLRAGLTTNSTDVDIVAAAYEECGVDCFAKLIGDWALSIWNPVNGSLTLAKDPIGSHHLYYSIDKDHVTWSTTLDPLVLFRGKSVAICEEYVAGCLSSFAAPHLTPYVGIHGVPPSSSVVLRPTKHTARKYWDFDRGKEIRYRNNAEYEEHFRTAFAKAVERRLRSDHPVLAELSGGMDSSSIVSMADLVIARGHAECPRLDTISWYDDSDPNDGERAYFTVVEQKRGRAGCHIDLSGQKQEKDSDLQRSFTVDFSGDRFAATPVPDGHQSEFVKQYAVYMKSQGHRVSLSGMAGDEVTGNGVPTPTPELQDLIARWRFFRLARQLNAWAVKMKKPGLPLLWQAIKGFIPLAFMGVPHSMCPNPWLDRGFVRRNRAALCRYSFRVKLFGSLPSFQDHIGKLDGNRRFQAHLLDPQELLREQRCPYLDRDFLEFMFAIPREQVVGIGRRRSLMKRALAGIVPDELLNRKRKLIPQELPRDNPAGRTILVAMCQQMFSSALGFIDPNLFVEALHNSQHNLSLFTCNLVHTLRLEFWLRQLVAGGVVISGIPSNLLDGYLPNKTKQPTVP